MKNDNVILLEKPAENEDLLTGMLRQGAKELITKAVQAELDAFLSQHQDIVDGWLSATAGRNLSEHRCW